MKKLVLIAGLLFAAVVGAAGSIPFTFAPGTAIKSAEVNANFQSLQASAVAHESRLQGLEAAVSAKPADQLFCSLHFSMLTDGSAFPCIQASSPGTPRSLSMPQLLAEGWISVASGGGDPRIIMTFRK